MVYTPGKAYHFQIFSAFRGNVTVVQDLLTYFMLQRMSLPAKHYCTFGGEIYIFKFLWHDLFILIILFIVPLKQSCIVLYEQIY